MGVRIIPTATAILTICSGSATARCVLGVLVCIPEFSSAFSWACCSPSCACPPGSRCMLASLPQPGVQPFLQAKPFKIVSRTLLGVAASSYWLSGVLYVQFPVSRFAAVLTMVVAFAIVLAGLTDLRRRFPADPCRDCPLGRYPTCEWNLPRLLQGIDDADLLRAVRARRFSTDFVESPARHK